MTTTIDLAGKGALVFGVANHRSIAWAIARQLHEAGADLTLTFQNKRLHPSVQGLAENLGERTRTVECDVTDESAIDRAVATASEGTALSVVVHSVAFSRREDLEGNFSKTDREGFRTALEVSAYSLISVARCASASMPAGGSIIAMTFDAAERVYPHYNIMGVAKAALENEVRLLAAEYGPRQIRVNAISAGPVGTLAARGIRGFTAMQQWAANLAPLRRNITQEEVGRAALFLASDLSSGITGEVIYVDAGYHIMGAGVMESSDGSRST